jgi:lipopolysaccharide-binding protein
LQGEFFSISNHQEAPFTPNPLPAVNDTGKMMYVWLTEYMADTAGFVYQQAGQLNYNVTPSMVSRK